MHLYYCYWFEAVVELIAILLYQLCWSASTQPFIIPMCTIPRYALFLRKLYYVCVFRKHIIFWWYKGDMYIGCENAMNIVQSPFVLSMYVCVVCTIAFGIKVDACKWNECVAVAIFSIFGVNKTCAIAKCITRKLLIMHV